MKFKFEIFFLIVILLVAIISGIIEILSQNYQSALGITAMATVLIAIIVGLWLAPQTT